MKARLKEQHDPRNPYWWPTDYEGITLAQMGVLAVLSYNRRWIDTKELPGNADGSCRALAKRGLIDIDEALPPTSALGGYDNAFETVWETYPRKTAKAAAHRAFVARLKEGVSARNLQRATIAYRVERAGEPNEFTMHGSTFYGPDRRWEDYLTSDDPDAEPEEPPVPMVDCITCTAGWVYADGPDGPVSRCPDCDGTLRVEEFRP